MAKKRSKTWEEFAGYERERRERFYNSEIGKAFQKQLDRGKGRLEF